MSDFSNASLSLNAPLIRRQFSLHPEGIPSSFQRAPRINYSCPPLFLLLTLMSQCSFELISHTFFTALPSVACVLRAL